MPSPSARARRLALTTLLGTLAGVIACSRGADHGRGSPGATALASEVERPTTPTAESDEVRSVYPVDATSSDPRVLRLCAALQDLPARRHAECCHAAQGIVVTRECERMLDAALRDGAVTLAPLDVDRCIAAVDRDLAGCDWVGPHASPPPPECRDLLRGTVREGARCRSSLECLDGLHCIGVGPTSAGTCGPPQDPGTPCYGSVDALAVYARQSDYEAHHAECKGACVRRRCVAEWDGGTRARARPKRAGEACTTDTDCAGECERTGDAPSGVCIPKCS